MNKVFHFFIILSCLSLLVWQGFQNIQTYLAHPSAQRMSSQSLLATGFPKIEICLTPGFDKDYIKQIGYETLTNFGKGVVNNNGQIIYGWSGNGSNTIDHVFENDFDVKEFR